MRKVSQMDGLITCLFCLGAIPIFPPALIGGFPIVHQRPEKARYTNHFMEDYATMKNIFTILSELEIEVPDDKKDAIENGLKEN